MPRITARMQRNLLLLIAFLHATALLSGCGEDKPKDEPELAGGITSGGYIVEQIPESLSKRGIEVRRSPIGLDIHNFGASPIKIMPVGRTIPAGAMISLNRSSDLATIKLLEIRDASDSFLGTIDIESFLQSSRSPE